MIRLRFNENWIFQKPGCVFEAVTLPHTWNAKDGTDGGNDDYRGTCVYEKSFPKPALSEGEELWIEFRGAAMTAEVSLNGEKLAHHEGGYSTFRVNLTEALAEENLLSVSVDNSKNDRVYPQKADFTFYGGLYRDVYLPFVTLPDIRSFNLYYGWYVGEKEQNDDWFDSFHQKHPDTVIGLSEYGADASPVSI